MPNSYFLGLSMCNIRFGFLMTVIVFCFIYSSTEASEQSKLNCRNLENRKLLKGHGDDILKGTQNLHTYVSVSGGDRGKGEMYALHAGYGYFLWDRFSVNIDILGACIRSGIDDNGVAAGIDVLLCKHFYKRHDDLWSMYFDAGCGLQQQSTNFSGRRHFNFRLLGGFGGTLKIFDHLRVMGGIRYLHSSDAGIKGGGGGFDGFMFYSGGMVSF